jgi:hypothetical protein
MRVLPSTKTQWVYILVVALVPAITSASNSPAFSFSLYVIVRRSNNSERERKKEECCCGVKHRGTRKVRDD